MRTLYLILYIIAAVLFALAAFVPTIGGGGAAVGARRQVVVNPVALGLLVWVLVPLIQTADRLGD